MDRLDKHFRRLTKAVFSRYGFAYGEVLSQWPAIVGEDLGHVSVPERIRWPRAGGRDSRKAGGTLVLRVAEGRALEVQHLVPRILERINGFYGYEAVSALKILQGGLALPPRAKPEPAPGNAGEALCQRMQAIEDEALRSALLRLGTAVSQRNPSTSHTPSPARMQS